MGPGSDAAITRDGDDNELFARLYEEHRVPLLQFCAARLGDVELAEDVVQESFVKAFLQHDRYDGERPYWPWLASIAARECIRAHRRRTAADARVERLSAELRVEPPDPTAVEVLGLLDQAKISRAVDELPGRQGAALRLLAIQGLSHAEVGAQLGASIAAVRTLVMRGRARLRDKFATPLSAFVGAGRLRRWRQRRLIVHAEASFAMWSSHVAGYVPAAARLPAAPMLAVAVAVSMSAVLDPPVPPGAGLRAVESTVAVSSADTAQAPAGEPVHTWSQPPLRREQAAVERSVNDARDRLLPAPDEASIETSSPQSVAVSPGYGKDGDHTVFYSATSSSQPVLFVSRDGGAHWGRLPARGFAGGRRLMIPPAYPRDPTIFALGVQGLQVSRDGGESFETLIFGGGLRGIGGATAFVDAALPPDFGPEHPLILLVGGGTVFEYRFDTGDLEPMAVDTADAHHTVDLVRYGPHYPADPSIFLGSTRVAETSSNVNEKYPEGKALRCARELRASALSGGNSQSALRCERVAAPDSLTGRFFGHAGGGGAMLGFDSFDLHVSTDGGRSFVRRTPWAPFASQFVNDVAFLHRAGVTTTYVAAVDWQRKEAALYRSDDLGRDWERVRLALPALADGVRTVHATPSGRLIAAGMARGLACSEDGGRTWAPTCPTADTAAA